jgi:hypothetical protein
MDNTKKEKVERKEEGGIEDVNTYRKQSRKQMKERKETDSMRNKVKANEGKRK